MKINKIHFQYFRSFGPKKSSIDFDENLTFFVGKNHTGKSNLLKFLKELKLNSLPIEQEHILSQANWFNNEAGVERPLKFQIHITLDESLYKYLCSEWFITPIRDIMEINSENLNINAPQCSPVVWDEIFSYSKLEAIFHQLLPSYKCLLRIEFIRFSEKRQEINYSIQFNNIILVNTADGRTFIQNLRNKSVEKYKEYRAWDEFLWDYVQEQIKCDDDELLINWASSSLSNETLWFVKMLNHIIQSSEKFIISVESLVHLYTAFLDKLIIIKENMVLEPQLYTLEPYELEGPSDLNRILAMKLNTLRIQSLQDKQMLHRYHELQKNFQAMYDDLDIVFGIDQDREGFFIKYYQTSTNTIIYNFDSIGHGITEMLNFLFILIVNTNQFICIDSPEYQLHPHSQRHLYNLLSEYTQRNHHQTIIITHSPYFFQPNDLFSLRLFELSKGITNIRKVEMPENTRDLYRLKRNFTIRNRSAIFADGLILVEGPSEEMSFPYFFRSFGLDLDLNNLSLINLHGKGSFAIFWKFAHQLHKKFWFFFDNDVLGVKAGEIITPAIFKRSIIFKNRTIFPQEICRLCEEIAQMEQASSIDFHEELELLRNILHNYHIFIFMDDFEGIFEEFLNNRIHFHGGKVEKAMQLVEYLHDHEEDQLLPERMYPFIELIQEELKK